MRTLDPDAAINTVFTNSFILGFFDGHGTFHIQHQKNSKLGTITVSANRRILEQLNSIFLLELQIPPRIILTSTQSNRTFLVWTTKSHIFKIRDWLYKDNISYNELKYRKITVNLPPPNKETKGCIVEGCKRKHVAKGYCSMHYQRAIQVPRSDRFSEPGTIKKKFNNRCEIENCLRKHHAKGYCQIHYWKHYYLQKKEMK